jgi:hypothetical protein
MGHTRFKRKKIRQATKKKWRGGDTITKTKRVQQSFDTIHDFYDLERGFFLLVLKTNVDKLRAELAAERATLTPAKIASRESAITEAGARMPLIPLYRAMRSIMQYMIITLTSITESIPILATIHDLGSINADTSFGKYVGNKKQEQLFFAGNGIPNSGVTTSGIEKSGVAYFEIPEGRTMPNKSDAKETFINLVSILFNLDNNPDEDIKKAYNRELGKPDNDDVPTNAKLTDRHNIYMVCDAGAGTYGKLADSVRVSGDGPLLTQLVNQCETADSASSNPYVRHKFVFVASDPENPDADVFVSDANTYTSDIYEIRYERHNWSEHTGLGFRLVISRKATAGSPKTELLSLVYGVKGSTQANFVPLLGSRAAPAVYNSQGPSAALMAGCALLRALGAFPDIPDEKIGKQQPVNPLSPQRVRDMVATAPIPGLPAAATLREQIVNELIRIMTPTNGYSLLSATADMVDPYSFLDNQFGNFPPELWLDIKRGGDRDQVKALHILSQKKDKSGNLKYPFIHFVTPDFLAAKMAVELGLAVIYQGAGMIRYWPKMFRFRPESRIPALSLYRITTDPFPDAATGDWQISLWGGKQMKGGLRNPISADIRMPPYTHIEDYEGRQYTYHELEGRNIPKIILHGLWLNPSGYVSMQQLTLSVSQKVELDGVILQFFSSVLQDPQFQQQIQQNTYFQQDPQGKHRELLEQIQQFQQEITQQQQEQQQQDLHARIGQILPDITRILLGINYTTLDSSRVQPMFYALQQLQLLHPNNSGIYQYNFLNTLLFNNSTEINVLDELTFRAVNNSKEDDGLEGAALIGENSPEVTVTSDDGQHRWTIPALLNTDLLKYDMNFMANRFLISLVLYFNDTTFTRDEIINFMSGKTDAGGVLEENGSVPASRVFMINYGINPIVSYIRAKYAVEVNDLDRLKNQVGTLITGGIGAAIQFHVPRATGAFKRKTPIKAKTQTAFTPSLGSVGPVAAASSVLPPVSSNPPPASFAQYRSPPLASNRSRIPSQSSSSSQSAFGQPYLTSLGPTSSAAFGSASWSSPQLRFGNSPFSSVSLGPTPSAAFAQPSSSSLGQAAAPLTLKLTRKASNSPGQRLAIRAITLKQGKTTEEARRNRENEIAYLRKKQRQAAVNKRRRAIPGGRRRTQKNHKRKRHGTQRKRSH